MPATNFNSTESEVFVVGRPAIDISGVSFGNLLVLERDKSAKSGNGKHAKWLCKCLLCDSVVSIRGSDLRSGRTTDCGCMTNEKCGKAHLVERAGDAYGHLTVLRRDLSKGVKSGRHAHWICRCELCGSEESVAANLITEFGKDRRHNCMHKSIGESRIADILDANGIRYVRDRLYGDCINEKTNYGLRFDFRIIGDDKECLYLIEYDGAQHYRAAPMWDDTMSLKERQMRDRMKNKWCSDRGIPLIRIPFTHLSKLSIDDLCLESTRYRIV